MIWEGWAAVYLFLEMLEFWRILSLKIFKMLHDEFLYDESLNSYHSHIYMLARLWTTHLLYYLWALSVVKLCRPLGACHVVKIKIHLHVHSYMLLLLRKYASTYIHSFPSPIHPKLFYSYPGENSQKHYPIPVIPREINDLDILVTTTCYIILGGCVLWKKSEYKEIKRGKCPEPRKKKKKKWDER